MSAAVFLEKARQNLKDAQVLLAYGGINSSCSRAYYAMHDAARAALFASGHIKEAHSKTHSGLIAQYNLVLVKSGVLSAETSQSISNASRSRIFADYDGAFMERDVAEEIIGNAERMVSEVEAYLANLP